MNIHASAVWYVCVCDGRVSESIGSVSANRAPPWEFDFSLCSMDCCASLKFDTLPSCVRGLCMAVASFFRWEICLSLGFLAVCYTVSAVRAVVVWEWRMA